MSGRSHSHWHEDLSGSVSLQMPWARPRLGSSWRQPTPRACCHGCLLGPLETTQLLSLGAQQILALSFFCWVPIFLGRQTQYQEKEVTFSQFLLRLWEEAGLCPTEPEGPCLEAGCG